MSEELTNAEPVETTSEPISEKVVDREPPKSTREVIREQAAILKDKDTDIDKDVKKPDTQVKQTDQEKVKRPVGRPRKEVAVAPQTQPAPVPLDPIIPPASLTKEEKAHFQAAPREIQEIVARRERERDRGLQMVMQQRAQLEREYGTYHQALAPHLNRMQRYGLQPDAFVGRMVAWDDAMQQDPIKAGIQFLKAYGVDPRQLIRQGPNGQLMPAFSMPEEAPEVPGLRPLQEKIEQLEGMLAERHLAEYQQYANNVQQERVAWQEAKDANGQLLHPYIEDMEGDIASYIKALKKNDPNKPTNWYLDRAYHLALKDHPEIEDAVKSRQQVDAKKEEIAREKQRAEVSKRGNITPASNGAPSKPSYKGLSTRQIIERVARGE